MTKAEQLIGLIGTNTVKNTLLGVPFSKEVYDFFVECNSQNYLCLPTSKISLNEEIVPEEGVATQFVGDL